VERPEESVVSRHQKRWGKIILLTILVLFLVPFFGVGLAVYKFPLAAKTVYNFIASPANQIASNGGKTNILVMGKSGGAHDGADLTDTMILVSVSLDRTEIKMISIPRDIWIPEIRAKINSAYYWGKQGTPYFTSQETGGGIAFAKKITEEVVGQPIQYGAVIDSSSFRDIIDALGGIEVNVENGFTDKLYPIEGRENDTCEGDTTFTCRYETIIFNPGVQTMNGGTALKFVRSRHAEGTEGTDIARESRQQKIVGAIKEKITQPKVLLNPKVDAAMLNIVKKYVETDIDLPASGILIRLILDGSKNINQFLIPDGLLVNPPISKAYDNLYVFTPKAGNGKWEEINEWFTLILGI